MTEKTSTEITIALPEQRTYTLRIETPEGAGKITFRRLKSNEYMKNLIDSQKNAASFEQVAESYRLVFSKIASVEGLRDEGEVVTLERIQAGEISQFLADLIVKNYWALMRMEQEKQREAKEAEEKNASTGEDSPPA